MVPAVLRESAYGDTEDIAVDLHESTVNPAGNGAAQADLVPSGRSGVLAQDVVAGGGAGGNDARPAMVGTRARAYVEAGYDGGLVEAQLRAVAWPPGPPGEMAGLPGVPIHPAGI